MIISKIKKLLIKVKRCEDKLIIIVAWSASVGRLGAIIGGPTVLLMTDATVHRGNIELHPVWFCMWFGQSEKGKENEKVYNLKHLLLTSFINLLVDFDSKRKRKTVDEAIYAANRGCCVCSLSIASIQIVFDDSEIHAYTSCSNPDF